jgi:S-layer protein
MLLVSAIHIDPLTAGTDNFPGGAANDTINAVLQDASAAGTTIQPGDVVNGGAGTDTLSISVAGDIGTTSFTISAVQANSVENVLAVNFNTDDATDLIVATNLMTGVTTVGASASSASGDTQFTGMKNMVAAEMSNGAGDLALVYDGAQVVTGTADAQTLNVSNMTAGTFTADGIETLNINSGLVKSTLAAAASNALKTVNVTGATDLKITAALDFASNGTATAPGAVVNASTFTGKLDITTTASEIYSVTGGSGDDTFTLGTLTKDDVVVGGAGNDTINMPAAGLTTEFAKVSGVEKVAFTAATANLAMDVSKLSAGVTTVEFNLSDGTDNTTAVTGTISNLGSQTVVLKHSTANAGTDTDADGANAAITGAVDTTADRHFDRFDAIGMVATNKLGYDSINVANFEKLTFSLKVNNSDCKRSAVIDRHTDKTPDYHW